MSSRRTPLGDCGRRVLGYLIGVIAWCVSRSFRMREVGTERRLAAAASKGGGGVLFAIPHEQQIAAIATNEIPRMVTIASRSKDGDLIAAAMRLFRVRPARGSSSRGGALALLVLQRWVEAGHACAITVDGPRGPRRKAKTGIVRLAAITGRPIVCSTIVADRVWRTRSWDRLEVPKPFCRVIQMFGEPFFVSPAEEVAAVQARIDAEIETLDQRARALVGRPSDWRSE